MNKTKKIQKDLSHLLKFETLYNASPDLYRTINKDGIIVDCNNSYASSLGYKKEEVIGESIFDHIADCDVKTLQDSFDAWKKNGKINNREMWFKRKDGSIFPCLLSSATIYDKNGNPQSTTFIKDMTEIFEARKKIIESEKQIRKQYELLKQVEVQKDEFVAMITHELKTPLFPIAAHCEMLINYEKTDNLTKEQLESIKEIHSCTKKLERLVGDILDAEKLELGQCSFNITDFDTDTFTDEIFRSYKPVMNENIIDFSISNNASCMIKSDKDRLVQVFRNLLENAINFAPPMGAKIEIGLRVNHKAIVFYVKDNGPGIPKEKQERLFSKFYQVDTSLRRKHGGSGLGLVICKGIMEGLGGRIWVDSDKGKGATFYFSIPQMRREIELVKSDKLSNDFSCLNDRFFISENNTNIR